MQGKPINWTDVEKIELRPDGEKRFLAAVDAAKSGPKPRTKAAPAKRSVVKKRKR